MRILHYMIGHPHHVFDFFNSFEAPLLRSNKATSDQS